MSQIISGRQTERTARRRPLADALRRSETTQLRPPTASARYLEAMVGVDVVDIERLRRAMAGQPRLEKRLFTSEERAFCRAKADPAVHFAGTLAAKEAVIKAWGLGSLAAWGARVEIVRDARGRPTAGLRGSEAPSWVELSISHDGGVAVAVALARPPDASLETR